MANKEVKQLPDFLEEFGISNGVIHKEAGISYQNLTNIIKRRDTSKVFIEYNKKTGKFRIFREDLGEGFLNPEVFNKRME